MRFGEPEFYLVGVLKGHYNYVRTGNLWENRNDVTLALNNGISMVTPSYLLNEILFSDNVKEERLLMAKSKYPADFRHINT